jgi:hypothetical protein
VIAVESLHLVGGDELGKLVLPGLGVNSETHRLVPTQVHLPAKDLFLEESLQGLHGDGVVIISSEEIALHRQGKGCSGLMGIVDKDPSRIAALDGGPDGQAIVKRLEERAGPL